MCLMYAEDSGDRTYQKMYTSYWSIHHTYQKNECSKLNCIRINEMGTSMSTKKNDEKTKKLIGYVP